MTSSWSSAPQPTTGATSGGGGGGGPPRILQNPYAQRKPPPDIFKDPLNIDDDGLGGAADTTNAERGTCSKEPLDQPSSSAASTSSTSVHGPPPREADKEEESSSKTSSDAGSSAPVASPRPHQHSVLPATRRSDIPAWERLPSRSLSFTSAEIVTVSELLREGREISTSQKPVNEKGRGPKARSVRVLGVLTHKVVHSDASVSMVLKDPLDSAQNGTPKHREVVKPPSSIRPSKFQRVTPPSAVPLKNSRPNSTFATAGQTPDPNFETRSAPASSAPRPQLVRTATATPVVRSMIRPQPLRSRSAPPVGAAASGSSSTSSNRPLTAAPKRPWSAVRPNGAVGPSPNPLQSLAALVISHESPCGHNLWVVVRPGYDLVNQLVMGDLVTVIGEVHWVPSGDYIADDAASIPEAVRQVLAPQMLLDHQEHQEEGLTRRATSTPSNRHVMYLLARILFSSNGMNPALFVEALNARRKLLARSCSTDAS